MDATAADYLTADARMLRAALDDNPGDVSLACRLADELQAAGAPPGVVALARLDRVPWRDESDAPDGWYWCPMTWRTNPSVVIQVGKADRSELPREWIEQIEPKGVHGFSAHATTRDLAEEMATAAFDRLSAKRRAELLRGEWSPRYG